MSIIRLHSVVLAGFNPLEPVVSVPLFRISVGGWEIPVSNHMFVVTVGALLLVTGIPLIMRTKRMVAAGYLQNLIESICVYLREEVAKPVMGMAGDRYIGFVWTVFFFVLTLNLLGMVPTEKIIMLLTGRENRLGGPATANIWITGAMAAVTFFMTHITGIREQGLWRYIVNFAPPVPWWMIPLIYFLEIIGAFVKPFVLAIRLFANMIAGHMILATFIGLIFILKSYGAVALSMTFAVGQSFLELFVAFLQAFIFTFLSALYIGSSIQAEH